MKDLSPKVYIKTPPKEIQVAFKLIDKFLKLNKIVIPTFDLIIDCSIDSFGVFYPGTTEIHVNIDLINNLEPERIHSRRYIDQYNLDGVVLHEFCHYFLDQYKNKLLDDFTEEFKEEKNFLNYNSSLSVEEYFVESLCIYLTNPFLLKLVEGFLFDFYSERFKSPTPCTKVFFIKTYDSWNDDVKNQLEKIWKIKCAKGKIISSLT